MPESPTIRIITAVPSCPVVYRRAGASSNLPKNEPRRKPNTHSQRCMLRQLVPPAFLYPSNNFLTSHAQATRILLPGRSPPRIHRSTPPFARYVHPLPGGPGLPVAEFLGEFAPAFFGFREFGLNFGELIVELQRLFGVGGVQHVGVDFFALRV